MKNKINNENLLAAFRSLLKNSSDMIFIKNKDLIYLTASDSFIKMVGLQTPEMIEGKTDWEIFSPELAKKYTRDDTTLLTSGNYIKDTIEPLPAEGGRVKTSSTSKYPFYNDNGEIIGLYGVARDITEHIELQTECESSRFSRQILFDSVIEADITNDKMLKIIGKRPESIDLTQNTRFSQVITSLAENFLHENNINEFLYCYDIDKLKKDFSNGILDLRHVMLVSFDSGYKWYEFLSSIYHSKVSNTLCISIFMKDIDEDIKNKEKLQTKASTDSLTGLFNRENIFKSIRSELKRANDKSCFALLFIDLDNFKHVNDNHGHLYGDKVLQQSATYFKNMFLDNAICGRVGGDEFLIFVKDVLSKKELEAYIQQSIKDFNEENKENDITCSIGIVLCSNETKNVDMLYKQADKAMYMAKKAGKNQLHFLNI